MYRADTIVACATPPGRGGIAIVRLSGGDCARISKRMFDGRSRPEMEPWRLVRGKILDGARGGRPLDEALAVYYPAPRTYTGEDVLEFHCHGAPVVVEQVIAGAVACGARLAAPGEFSRRAVLNGKMDLLQAEAVADLIEARVAAGARAAWDQLQGALSKRLGAMRSDLLDLLASLEAHVDFSDDDLPEEDPGGRVAGIAAVERQVSDLLGGFEASRRVREGIRVVFAGRPNAGKSSLINRLLGFGRMIVSDEEGTTRDVVEECIDLGGMAFVLTDTAGLRDSRSRAETEAVLRARAVASEADVVVLVVDSSVAAQLPQSLPTDACHWAGNCTLLVAFNKSDLPCAMSETQMRTAAAGATREVRVSAVTGEGCEALVAALRELGAELADGDCAAISRVRHREALGRALDCLAAARGLSASGTAPELAAIELRQALRELESLTEPVGSEEVLDRIFASFCIGK